MSFLLVHVDTNVILYLQLTFLYFLSILKKYC